MFEGGVNLTLIYGIERIAGMGDQSFMSLEFND
jgi:hypothetical protein